MLQIMKVNFIVLALCCFAAVTAQITKETNKWKYKGGDNGQVNIVLIPDQQNRAKFALYQKWLVNVFKALGAQSKQPMQNDSSLIDHDIPQFMDKEDLLSGAVDAVGLTAVAATSLLFPGIGEVLVPVVMGAELFGDGIEDSIQDINRINKLVPLTGWETFKEGVRSFIGLGPSYHIRELVNEEQANQIIAKKVIDHWSGHNITYHVVASGIFEAVSETHNILKLQPDNYIDLQHQVALKTISRVLPKALGKDFRLFCKMGDIEYNPAREGATMDYHCKNAFGIWDRKFGQSETMLFTLNDGKDVVYAANINNVFLLGNGRKTISGGKGNDRFIVYGNSTSGVINGSTGYNILDLSHYGNLPYGITFYTGKNDYNQKFEVKVFDLLASDIHEIIGRENGTEMISTWDCKLARLDLQGGHGSENYYDKDGINIYPGDCPYNMTIVLQGYIDIQNAASDGQFKYVIDGAQKTVATLGHDENKTDITIIFKNVSIQDASINYDNELNTINIESNSPLSNVSQFLSIYFIHTRSVGHMVVHFEDGVVSWDNKNRMAIICRSEEPVADILDKRENYERLWPNADHVMMLSKADNKAIMFSHKSTLIVKKDGSTEKVNIVHNMKSNVTLYGRPSYNNYFMIQGQNRASKIEDLNLGTITIEFTEDTENHVSLHHLLKQVKNLGMYDVIAEIQSLSGNDLILSIFANDISNKVSYNLTTIQIINGLVNEAYASFMVHLYSKLLFVKANGKIELQPFESIMVDPKLILLVSPDKFDRNSILKFNSVVKSPLSTFQINNKHLVIANIPNGLPNNGMANFVTIVLMDYFNYKEKFDTLKFEFHQEMLIYVKDVTEKMKGPASIDGFWKKIEESSIKSSQYKGTVYKI